MSASLGELATQFGCELIGDPAARVARVATLSNAGPDCLSFLANPAYREQLRATGAAAVIVKAADAEHCPTAALLAVDPYLTYARVADVLHPRPLFAAGIHSTAVVAASARVAESAHIAAHVVIGDDSVIGEDAIIGPNCVIGDRCAVGKAAHLIAGVTLVQDATIGARGMIHSGTVVGSDGFGNAMSDSGWVKVPQVGGVRIGDDVEIGANTTIDRGAIDDTVIENGVRLDNLIQIAHNVRIGEHTAMAAMTGISGSTVIGKRCMFGGAGGTIGHLVICDDVVVTGCTMVTKNISEPGVYSGSFAAEKGNIWKRRVARFRRLGELADRVSKLERAARDNDD